MFDDDRATTLRARAELTRTVSHRLVDRLTRMFGSSAFLVGNIAWVAASIGLREVSATAMSIALSFEAIFLSIFVLISQNRAAKLDELRAEIDLRINMIAEQELTKVLQIVAQIAGKHGIDLRDDPILHAMTAPTNLAKIERELENAIAPK